MSKPQFDYVVPPASAAAYAHGIQAEALLGHVLDELVNSALLCATTGSIANSLEHSGTGISKSALGFYLAPEASLFRETQLMLCTMPQLNEAASVMSEYYKRMDFLQQVARRFAEGGEGERAHNEIASIALAWRNLAAVGRDAIVLLAAQVSAETYARCEARLVKCCRLLSSVDCGKTPCVNDFGEVSVPFWFERRQSRRVQVNHDYYVISDNRLHKVKVIEASLQGLKVEAIGDAAVGSRIELLISPGTSIAGKIAWVSGNLSGISLNAPLPKGSRLRDHVEQWEAIAGQHAAGLEG